MRSDEDEAFQEAHSPPSQSPQNCPSEVPRPNIFPPASAEPRVKANATLYGEVKSESKIPCHFCRLVYNVTFISVINTMVYVFEVNGTKEMSAVVNLLHGVLIGF